LFSEDLMLRLNSKKVSEEITLLEVQERAYQAIASSLPDYQEDDSGDGSPGMVIVFRDVTRFHELDRMKTQFVSDVSHELRTPLTSLSLYLDLLTTEEDPERRHRFQATLRRETNRLTQLIEDLLTISRLESNRVSINILPIDVNQLVKDLALDRSPIAAQRNISLKCSTQADIPLTKADTRMLTQVISNLLTNAINYTPPEGQVNLQTGCQEDENGQWVFIAVEDTGVGILPEELPHIFERFYRGSASRQTNAPGTGLGLAISKEILDRMNGRITVQTEPGKGSTFTVWLQAVL
jgi:signal transduction histidine kinase